MRTVYIEGTGSAFPEQTLSSEELGLRLGKSADWITSRTGIGSRHIASPSEEQPNATLGFKASSEALFRAGQTINDMDHVIFCSATVDRFIPNGACDMMSLFGPKKPIPCHDINAACAGFLFGFSQAHAMIASGQCERVLVVGSEVLSRYVDWKDPGTCIIFGDGAGAMVLAAKPHDDSKGKSDTKSRASRLIGHKLFSDASQTDILYIDLHGYEKPPLIKMNGREVFRHAVTKVGEAIRLVLEHTGISADEIDHLVPHQANMRIIDGICTALQFPASKVVTNLEQYGNTSAASIPAAFHQAVVSGRIQRGDLVCFAGLGAGLTYGASLFRY